MPGASGPELTRQLVERRPALKVIYMSGYTEDAIVHHGVLNPGSRSCTNRSPRTRSAGRSRSARPVGQLYIHPMRPDPNVLLRTEPCTECGGICCGPRTRGRRETTARPVSLPNGHVLDPGATRQCPGCGSHDTTAAPEAARSRATAAGINSRSAHEKGPAKAGHYRNPEAERRPIFVRRSVFRKVRIKPDAHRNTEAERRPIFVRRSVFR